MKNLKQKKRNRIAIIIPVILTTMLLFCGLKASAAVQDTYIVKYGDYLTKIAQKLYGNARCWPILASVPNNNIDFQKYIYPNQKMTVPPQSDCDDIQNTVRMDKQPLEQKTVSNVQTQPWNDKLLLIDDYIEGHYRDYSEYVSIDRVYKKNAITNDMFEWMNTPGNGDFPMAAFAEASGLFDFGYEKIDNRRYILRINDMSPSLAEREQEDRMAKRASAYIVAGDNIKETTEYRDGSHWGIRVQPKDEPLSSFFVIDGVKTNTYYHASRLTIFSDGSWTFRYQRPDKTCEANRYDNCSGAWFIKTSDKEYGPYENVTPPIPTADKDIYFWTMENGRYALYKNGTREEDWRHADLLYYTKGGNGLVFRAREGDLWYVVTDGTRSQAWDYVDLISANPTTGSVFYRARNKAGEWFVVKNNEATKTPFEPRNIVFNPVLDEPMATETSRQGDRVDGLFGKNNYWKYDAPVRLIAIDSKGNMLFQSTESVSVITKDANGKQMEVCSSSTCNYNYVYWINNNRIGEAAFRMIPLFSEKPAVGQTAFYYEGNERVFKYYGEVIAPAFDNQDRLVIYVIDDYKLEKTVYSFD
ncbi:MAG TPA: hypothetical protein VMX18_02110 [Candidatus Bipolaricaulota bacterium]|nr:hypothetical protein [Candidatus Bipolaricaulota bacterium]